MSARRLDCRTLAREDGVRLFRGGGIDRQGEPIFRADCPLCADKHRDRPLAIAKGWWKCHRCKREGRAVDWLHERRGLSQDEIKRLAGTDAPRRKSQADRDRDAREAERERLEQEQRAAQKAESVRQMGDEAVPIKDAPGNPAELYLRSRGINYSAGQCPDAMRYHPGKRALLTAGTWQDGRVSYVHLVYLTRQGAKRTEWIGGKLGSKQTFGPMPAGTCMRLPGPADAPIVLCEGVETGATVHCLRGWETHALGGVDNLAKAIEALPAGRLFVLAAEAYAEGSQARTRLAEAVAQARSRGARIAVCEAATAKQGGDLNDVLQERGADAVLAQLDEAVAGWSVFPHTARTSLLPAYYDPPSETVDEAKQRQDDALLGHLREAELISAARRELHTRRTAAILEEAETIAARSPERVAPADPADVPPRIKAAITRQLIGEIAEKYGFGRRIPKPPRLMQTGGQGTGKSTIVREFAAGSTQPDVWVFNELTTDKAKEEFLAYLEIATPTSPPAMRILGRDKPDPTRPDHQICDRADAAARIAKAGLSVVQSLCTDCPFRDECGYWRQRREAKALIAEGRGGVFFQASAYLFPQSPITHPDHVVIDETIIAMSVDQHTIKPEMLDPQLPHIGIDTRNTLSQIFHAIRQPKPLAVLREAGVDRKELRTVVNSLEISLDQLTPALSASMSDEDIARALKGPDRARVRAVLGLVRALKTEIDMPRDTLTGIVVKADGTVDISRRQSPRGISQASLTVLDGTGDVDLMRKLVGANLRHVHVPFPRNAHVTGTTGRKYSRQSITGMDRHGQPIANKAAASERLRREIGTIQSSLPAGSLLGGTKRVVDRLVESGVLPADTPRTHLSKMRGLNTWEKCEGVAVFGAEYLSIGALEGTARAFLADDPAPFVSMDYPAPKGWEYEQWPYKATRMRRMADGTLQPVEVEIHPDPRVQRVYEQIREASIVQFVDRTRPIWNHRQFIVANDLCLDVTYDVIRTHRDLVAGGGPLERAAARTGILPCNFADFSRVNPNVINTLISFERAWIKYPHSSNKNPIWEMRVFNFRRPGQRGRPSKAWIDTRRHPDPAAALARYLGPVVLVDAPVAQPQEAAHGAEAPAHAKAVPDPAPPPHAPPVRQDTPVPAAPASPSEKHTMPDTLPAWANAASPPILAERDPYALSGRITLRPGQLSEAALLAMAAALAQVTAQAVAQAAHDRPGRGAVAAPPAD
ncbi:MAG: toprim domain-containing protein [Acetobacteraceae bacterium]